jgi:hypothetical protein
LFYIYNDGSYTDDELKREIRVAMIEAESDSDPVVAPSGRGGVN